MGKHGFVYSYFGKSFRVLLHVRLCIHNCGITWKRQASLQWPFQALNFNLKAAGEPEMPERRNRSLLADHTSDPVSPSLIYAPQGEKAPNTSSFDTTKYPKHKFGTLRPRWTQFHLIHAMLEKRRGKNRCSMMTVSNSAFWTANSMCSFHSCISLVYFMLVI